MTKERLLYIRLSALIITVVASLIFSFWLRSLDLHYENLPFHSVMESFVAILSLLIAFFIYKFDEGDNHFDRYHALALSLIAIGILSFFHAASPEYSVFVWLYTMGRILGAFILLALFLPERKLSPILFRSLPYGVTVLSIVISLSFIVLVMMFPMNTLSEKWDWWEKWANNATALFFFLSSLLFFRHYRREYKDADFFFGTFLVLLATTAFYFQFSHLWGGGWWFWHIINMGAFLIVLYYYVDFLEAKKVSEIKMKALHLELEQKVLQRTAELKNAYDEMEAFTYSVSHDLRSPLRATDGFSQALLEDYHDKLDEIGCDYLTRIRTSSQKMAALIDDLLQLSRQTRTEMNPNRIDLGKMARKIMTEFSEQEPDRNIEVVIAEELNVYADYGLMNVVLTNLLGNSWKYTSHKLQAMIELGKTEKNGEIIFYVRDNGAGFDMAYVGKLFKPFQRLHSTQEFSGNGIGLAMVDRIIKRHLGRVWAQGEVEKGTTIFFTLGLNDSIHKLKEKQI